MSGWTARSGWRRAELAKLCHHLYLADDRRVEGGEVFGGDPVFPVGAAAGVLNIILVEIRICYYLAALSRVSKIVLAVLITWADAA